MIDPIDLPIAIRAYTEHPDREALGARPPTAEANSSEWTLVFDCETSTDSTQQLRVGFFQVRRKGTLEVEGLFYSPEAISPGEELLLRRYAQTRRLPVHTCRDFCSEIFLKYAYTRHGPVVGFNLPFDLSRIAVDHGPARRNMRGGFSFQLTRKPDDRKRPV
jgi:hypothetical protein